MGFKKTYFFFKIKGKKSLKNRNMKKLKKNEQILRRRKKKLLSNLRDIYIFSRISAPFQTAWVSMQDCVNVWPSTKGSRKKMAVPLTP